MRQIVHLVIYLLLISGVGFPQWWFSKADEGLRQAKEQGKLVVFYFHSQYCVYCRQVEDFVLPDEEVTKKLKNFVVVSLDINSEEGRFWANRLGVFGTPTFVVYDPSKGSRVDLLFGSRPKEDFLRFFHRVCTTYRIKNC